MTIYADTSWWVAYKKSSDRRQSQFRFAFSSLFTNFSACSVPSFVYT
jgi:hypothetical protein